MEQPKISDQKFLIKYNVHKKSIVLNILINVKFQNLSICDDVLKTHFKH